MGSEKLLVCVGSSPGSETLVRRTAEMAGMLHAPWTAVHVTGVAYRSADRAAEQRVLNHLQLAEQLGAATAVLDGLQPAEAIVSYAKRENVTRIVIGKNESRGMTRFFRPDLASNIINRSGKVDVYVVRGTILDRSPEAIPHRPMRFVLRLLVALSAVAAATLFSSLFGAGQGASASVVMLYLAAVFTVSLAFGWVFGVGVSLLSVLAFNFFFTEPYLTLQVSDPSYLVTFAVMTAVSLVSSSLAARVRRQAEVSRSREHRTHVLYSLSRQLSGASGTASIVQTGRQELERLCGELAYVVLNHEAIGERMEPEAIVTTKTLGTDLPELAAADRVALRWCLEHGEPYGSGTGNNPRSDVIALPIRGSLGILGAALLKPRDQRRVFLDEERSLLETMTSLIGLAIERERATHEVLARRTEVETERLKGTLLRGISHDLRTPLATIAGSSSTLLQGAVDLATARGLLRSIYEEAAWMNRIVENMLNLTRIEAGNLLVRVQPETVDDLVTSAVSRVTRSQRSSETAAHKIDVDLPKSVLLANMDLPLMEQVLVNLLDNAIRYTPATSTIFVRVEENLGLIRLCVEDNGPGFSPEDLLHLFEKFYRGRAASLSRGSGLGLTISQAVVTAHGGTIVAENRVEGGARVVVSLPLVSIESAQPVL